MWRIRPVTEAGKTVVCYAIPVAQAMIRAKSSRIRPMLIDD